MQMELYSEEDILNGCKKNNRKYQELLYRKYAKKMYGICLSYAGERELAQDILQESYIKVFKKIKEFKEEGSLEGWIRRIVSNTAIDYMRQKSRIQNHINEKEERTENFEQAKAIENLQIRDLLDQVARLPNGARVVFNLFALEGYTHKEIAKKLNITEGTSKSQFNRARKLLMLKLTNVSV